MEKVVTENLKSKLQNSTQSLLFSRSVFWVQITNSLDSYDCYVLIHNKILCSLFKFWYNSYHSISAAYLLFMHDGTLLPLSSILNVEFASSIIQVIKLLFVQVD